MKPEHIEAIRQFGYSPKEAAFLTQVLLNSGYFLRRQFAPNGGEPADQLCRRVRSKGHASTSVFRGNTHLFYLRHKALYRALGQEDNRHRRPRDPLGVRSKLMCLDYVRAHPGYAFLPTEEDKVQYFTEDRGLPVSLLPTKTYQGRNGSTTDRYCVDKFPIRVDPARGTVAFCYIDDGVFIGPSFATWLAQYAPLIRALGDSEVVYVSGSQGMPKGAVSQFNLQFSPDSSPALRTYFEARRSIEKQGANGRPQAFLEQYRKDLKRYNGERFEKAYKQWIIDGEAEEPAPPARLSSYQLNYAYYVFGRIEGKR